MSLTYLIVDGDIRMSSATGRPLSVADDIKFKQDLSCNFTTDTRDNGFGAGLEELIGTVPQNTDSFTILAEQHIFNSLQSMQALQNKNPNIIRSNIEKIGNIDAVYVTQDLTDPRVYKYFAAIRTKAGQKLNATGAVA